MSWQVSADSRRTWAILQNSLSGTAALTGFPGENLLVNSLKFIDPLPLISDPMLSGSVACGTEYDSYLLEGTVYLP